MRVAARKPTAQWPRPGGHLHGRSQIAWSGISLRRATQAMAAKLIRALLAGRAAGDIVVLQDE
jgi:hypothetical protein